MDALLPPTIASTTHTVSNQSGALPEGNVYLCDSVLQQAVKREAGEWLHGRAVALGAAMGSLSVRQWGEEANRHPAELLAFDRFGRRLDEVRFHPSYHALMGLATEHRIHDIAWTAAEPGGHVAHAALLAIFAQVEAGTMCPVNMTYAAVPTLRLASDRTAPWVERLLGGRYDAPLAPIAEKRGLTLGMAMTEKQGGSDVRANATRAEPVGDDAYRLTGHKWFCSAPMSDGFLMLAQAPGGLSCFLVPRVTPDRQRNEIRLVRLKDKLGNRSNASAEIELEGALAWRIGEEGRGVKAIIEMVHHTRLGTVACTLGIMRAALREALHHARHRLAFGAVLADQPAMTAVLADLCLDYEAAVVLVMRVARSFDAADDHGRAFARLGVALAKFWLTQRCPAFVAECMIVLGGNGYGEDGPLARLFRESPLNAIWEGAGSVIALDVMRTLDREPVALAALQHELAGTGRASALARAATENLRLLDDLPARGAMARFWTERLALCLQAVLLERFAAETVSSAFVASRLSDQRSFTYGSLPQGVDCAAILRLQQA